MFCVCITKLVVEKRQTKMVAFKEIACCVCVKQDNLTFDETRLFWRVDAFLFAQSQELFNKIYLLLFGCVAATGRRSDELNFLWAFGALRQSACVTMVLGACA